MGRNHEIHPPSRKATVDRRSTRNDGSDDNICYCCVARAAKLSTDGGQDRAWQMVNYAPFTGTKVRYKLIGKPPVPKTGVGMKPCASSSLALTAKWIGLLVWFRQPRC